MELSGAIELLKARATMSEIRIGRRNKKEDVMGKVLKCCDLGTNCSKEIRADSEEELLKLAAEHAEKDHGIPLSSIPPAMLAMVKSKIQDE